MLSFSSSFVKLFPVFFIAWFVLILLTETSFEYRQFFFPLHPVWAWFSHIFLLESVLCLHTPTRFFFFFFFSFLQNVWLFFSSPAVLPRITKEIQTTNTDDAKTTHTHNVYRWILTQNEQVNAVRVFLLSIDWPCAFLLHFSIQNTFRCLTIRRYCSLLCKCEPNSTTTWFAEYYTVDMRRFELLPLSAPQCLNGPKIVSLLSESFCGLTHLMGFFFRTTTTKKLFDDIFRFISCFFFFHYKSP